MPISLRTLIAALLLLGSTRPLSAQSSAQGSTRQSAQRTAAAVQTSARWPLIAGINSISFLDSTRNNTFVGSGFVLRHAGRLYGVTAKHVLLVAGHPALKSINPGPLMRSWTMRAANSTQPAVAFGRLLNADSTETLGIEVLERDALVFALEQSGPFTPLTMASEALKPGDSVFVAGCSYQTEKTCTQNTLAGVYVETVGVNLLIDLGETALAEMGGMSGGPVINVRGELVGITSRSLTDSRGVVRFAPVDLTYLRAVLAKGPAGLDSVRPETPQ